VYGDLSKGSQANRFLNPKWPLALRFSAKRRADIGASGTLLSSASLITAGGHPARFLWNSRLSGFRCLGVVSAAGFGDSRADGAHRICSQHSWHVPFRA